MTSGKEWEPCNTFLTYSLAVLTKCKLISSPPLLLCQMHAQYTMDMFELSDGIIISLHFTHMEPQKLAFWKLRSCFTKPL